MSEASRSSMGGLHMKDFVFFDLETTGLDPSIHEIIEIGAVRMPADLSREIGRFTRKVIPTHLETADPAAFQKNGFRLENWTDAVPIEHAMGEFSAFARGSVLWGYNISFDWAFLRLALRQSHVAVTFDYHHLDVMSVAAEEARFIGNIEGLGLRAHCAYFHVPVPPDPHRALDDALATAMLLKAVRASRKVTTVPY